MCATHYAQWRKTCPPGVLKTHFKDPAEAFAARTRKDGACTLWVGGKGADGYGLIRVDGKVRRAHRYAWELVHGPLPDGSILDHACGIRACVGIDHLRVVTRLENNQYRTVKDVRNKSGFRGVQKTASGRWFATAMKDGRTYRIGTFDTASEAGAAVSKWRAENYTLGEFNGGL